MQLRRVLLLFALVLGVSALVAQLAPVREEREEQPRTPADQRAPEAGPLPAGGTRALRLRAPQAPRAHGPAPLHRFRTGSGVELEVAAREPGDVTIERLGLRQSAEPGAPARFAFVAESPGRFAVRFLPLRSESRLVALLEFSDPR